VQLSPSDSQGVLAGGSGSGTHMPVAGAQAVPPSQIAVGPRQSTWSKTTHNPEPLQCSMLQKLPSCSHGVLSGGSGSGLHAPVDGLQADPASQTPLGGGQMTLPVFTQAPLPSQRSIVHRLPSASQLVPAGGSDTGSQPPVAGVQAVPASHGPVGPGHSTSSNCTQLPAPSQCSMVQKLASSSHGVLSGGSGMLTQAPVAGLQF
jgi:hypothetical protein